MMMVTIEIAITLLAFFVFGLIGQVIVVSVVDVEYIAENMFNYLNYFGFAIGFLVFGFFYLNNIIEQLKSKRKEDEDLLATKNALIEEMDKTLYKCEQKVKITERENRIYAEKISQLLHE